jgi:RecB family exonuclease
MSEYNWHDEQELVDPEDSVFRLSASSVKAHSQCPYQFYLDKVVGLDETKVGKDYLSLGLAVHESIEEVLGQERWNSPPRPTNQLRQELISEFRDWNPDVEDDLWDRGINCLETAAKYLGELQSDTVVRDLEPEFNFSLGRPDISAKFKGFIDVTTEQGEIWDWKTGSVREKGEVIQGAVYMRGYQELYGEPPEKIRFVYLKEGKERALEPNDENWQAMLDHAKKCVQSIRQEHFEPDPDDSKCYWCGMEGHCYASPNGAGGIDYQTFRDRRAEY